MDSCCSLPQAKAGAGMTIIFPFYLYLEIPLDPPFSKGEIKEDPFSKGEIKEDPFSKGETQSLPFVKGRFRGIFLDNPNGFLLQFTPSESWGRNDGKTIKTLHFVQGDI